MTAADQIVRSVKKVLAMGGPSTYGPLDCFQSIDLALRLPIAPGLQHGVSDSVEVLTRSWREVLHGVDA